MSQPEYLIIRLKGEGKNHAVRICIGITIEELSISKVGEHYFLVFGACEIGFPLEVLEKIVSLINYIHFRKNEHSCYEDTLTKLF